MYKDTGEKAEERITLPNQNTAAINIIGYYCIRDRKSLFKFNMKK